MTTSAPGRETSALEELDERRRHAWSDYRESLRDLQGRDYESAEDESWVRLQDLLRDLDRRRAELDEAALKAR